MNAVLVATAGAPRQEVEERDAEIAQDCQLVPG